MSLRFIIGRAGTGKTYTCLKEIQQALLKSADGPPLIFLVPEQATFQTEVALLTFSPVKGSIRAQALSFRRLAWRIFQETGGAARTHISDLGKRIILRKLLGQRLGQLKLFHHHAKQPGFINNLAGAISELKLYHIKPDDLKNITLRPKHPGQKLLSDKLHDLAILYADLEAYLSDRYTDPDDYLDLLASKLEHSSFFRKAEIWIDGFTGFTLAEYKVIEKIFTLFSQVNITLCLDRKYINQPVEEINPFYPVKETFNKLIAIADKAGITVYQPLILDQGRTPRRFQHSPEIAYLEQNFFQRPARPFTSPNDPDKKHTLSRIQIKAGTNRLAEVEGVAREITRLCRDHGYRWREILVILRNIEPYYHLISIIFTDHGIPFFIDCKRPFGHHPLVELIRSALEVITQNWAYDPVFRYLKTGLTPLPIEKVDLLENYVLKYGIKGSRWVDGKEWTFRRRHTLGEEEQSPEEAEELAEINEAKKLASEALLTFQQSIKKTSKVREITAFLFNLLTSLNVPGKLEEWSRQASTEGKLEAAAEHISIWNNIIDLFDQVVEALGNETLPFEDYASIIDTGLESLKMGLIPPGLDQVIVGSLERSRNPNVRAAFILGVNEGVLPSRISNYGLFTENEQEQLEATGLGLAPGIRQRLFEEQFLIYTALTRASEYLCLSYSLADEEGHPTAPSSVITRIAELLPGLKETIWAFEPTEIQEEELKYITNPGRSLSYLASKLRRLSKGKNHISGAYQENPEINPIWWDVYNWFLQQEHFRDKIKLVLSSLFYANRELPVPAKVIEPLYSKTPRFSISQIEKFKACPFAHFLSYGLKLKEREIFKLSKPDLGQFFHLALKMFGERSLKDWEQHSLEDCKKLTREIVDTLAPELQNEILLSSARYRYLTRKLNQTIERAALVLSEHARRSKFKPIGLELSFGSGGILPPLALNLAGSKRVELSGRIDRVDLAKTDSGNYLRIIDYKSGSVDFSLTDIYHGLKLQLLTYLDVVLTNACKLTGSSSALPAGMLYFKIKNPLLKNEGPLSKNEAEKEILKKLKMKGMVLADIEAVKLMDDQIAGYSDLIPAALKNDGSFFKNSPVLTQAQFTLLRDYLRNMLQNTSQEIINGVAKINPYRKGFFTSCRVCPFKPVCQFDPFLEENIYRIINEEPLEVILNKMLKQLKESCHPLDISYNCK